ncbi:MAG: ATP-binding protein, partial [Pseudomonadota bacterium]|nr:ATP-binding protein [Pseudomonadota bacterium]
GDALALQRLISNVVINAGQAMPLGGALQVVLDSHQVVDLLRTQARDLHPGRYLRVTVRDTGNGMDERTLGRIFERGFTTRPGGSGLGLSGALDTLERHGGGIIVNSWPGTGTEANIYLPWSE